MFGHGDQEIAKQARSRKKTVRQDVKKPGRIGLFDVLADGKRY
jgi:hypothetical protein